MRPDRCIIILVLQLLGVAAFGQEIIRFGVGGIGEKFDCDDPAEYGKVLLDSSYFWHIGKPNKETLKIPDNGTFGEYSLFTDTNRYYRKNIHASIQFKLLLIDEGELFSIIFYRAYETEKNKDGVVFETSWDLGHSWNNVIHDSLITRNQDEEWNFDGFYSMTDSIESNPGQIGFTGDNSTGGFSGIFFFKNANLIGDTLLLRLTFTSDSIDANYEGWIMDEIVFVGQDFGKVNQSSLQNKYRVYPNPAIESINIVSPSGSPVNTIELISLTGKVLLRSKDTQLDISNIKEGFYVVRINGSHNLGVIVQKN